MNSNSPSAEHKPLLRMAKPSEGPYDPFRKSKLKESQIVIAEVCCSRHLYCIEHEQHQHTPSDTSFSVNSQLLVEYAPAEITAEPLIQYQIKPEVDMLAHINIKKRQYEALLQRCQEDISKEEREKKLRQISLEAKNALAKSKKAPHSPKSNWGHSVFAQEKVKQEGKETGKPKEKKEKKEIVIKPITERIKEYKEQQAKRDREQRQRNERKHREVNTQEQERIIKQNAEMILQQMRQEKLRKEEERKVIQAKIRALQLKSKQKVQQAKKKPLQAGQDFNLGDSQYSTFSARANNRKLEKKKKKEKAKQVVPQQLINTKPTSNFLRKSSRSKPSSAKLIKTQQVLPQAPPQQPVQEQAKGPFFIWNIPVHQQQLHKLQQGENKVFMNVERFNHKSGKTFRDEANEFLARKMQKKMGEERQRVKESNFLEGVQAKKQQLLRTFELHSTQLIQEHFWNEDEVFRPNVLENFHFYAKSQL